MAKLWKFLFAGLLVTAAVLSVPAQAAATDFCALCLQEPPGTTLSCYYCCKCDGGPSNVCLMMCAGSGQG